MGNLDEDLPPPYSYTEPLHPPSHAASSSQPQSLFSSHLSTLRSDIATEQAVRTSAQDQSDNNTLSLLIPHVEQCLSSITSIHPHPTVYEATLVPADAVDESWTATDHDDKRDGYLYDTIHVSSYSKLVSDVKRSSASSSGNELWWSDEDMARRLAKHLQPARPTAAVDRNAVKKHVQSLKETKKSSRWGLFKGSSSSSATASSSDAPTSAQHANNPNEDVSMTVTTEEKTFRKENDFGIWESKTGWGIVVRVRLR